VASGTEYGTIYDASRKHYKKTRNNQRIYRVNKRNERFTEWKCTYSSILCRTYVPTNIVDLESRIESSRFKTLQRVQERNTRRLLTHALKKTHTIDKEPGLVRFVWLVLMYVTCECRWYDRENILFFSQFPDIISVVNHQARLYYTSPWHRPNEIHSFSVCLSVSNSQPRTKCHRCHPLIHHVLVWNETSKSQDLSWSPRLLTRRRHFYGTPSTRRCWSHRQSDPFQKRQSITDDTSNRRPAGSCNELN
jgi:hypothetical protein